MNSPLFLNAEGAKVAHQQWKRVRELCCKVQMWKSLVPLSELPTVVLTVKFRARSMAVFETRSVHLTSEKLDFFFRAHPSPFQNRCMILSRLADKILLWQEPDTAGEKTKFCPRGFVVDFTGVAERRERGCVLCANIIIFGNNNTFHNPRTLQYQRGHDLQNGPIYIHQ